MIRFRTRRLLLLVGTILLIACSATAKGGPAGTSGYQEVLTTPLPWRNRTRPFLPGRRYPGARWPAMPAVEFERKKMSGRKYLMLFLVMLTLLSVACTAGPD